MREMDPERQPAIRQMIWLGFALGVFYWLIDSIVDTYVFHERSLSAQIFSPDA